MKTHKTSRRPGRTLLLVICSLLLLVVLVLVGGRLWFRLPVTGYYKASDAAFSIPGLSDGFVPQGLDYDEQDRVFLVGGYMKKAGQPSPVYAVDRSSGTVVAKASLAEADGSAFTGHAGGLAVSGDNVYVAGNDGVCIFDREAILAAADGESVQCLGKLYTRLSEDDTLGVAFVDITPDNEGDLLTAGEFYRDPQYPTPVSHKFTAPSGEYLQALAVTYRVSEDGGSLTPLRAYALPDLVQGLTFHDGKIWLSASWAVGFSHILAWDLEALSPFSTIAVDGHEIPLYALEAATRAVDYQIPPMSEEIVFVDGKLCTMCESASRKYWFGLLTGGQWCYSTALSDMSSGK